MREHSGMTPRISGLGTWADEGNNSLAREHGRDTNLLKENNAFSFISLDLRQKIQLSFDYEV